MIDHHQYSSLRKTDKAEASFGIPSFHFEVVICFNLTFLAPTKEENKCFKLLLVLDFW